MFSFKKFLNSQVGFSMMEIMVGGTILAGVGLGAAFLYKEQNFAQKRVSNDQILGDFHNAIAKHLYNIGNCNATFGHRYGQSIVDIDTIYNCNATANPVNCGTTQEANLASAVRTGLTAPNLVAEGQAIDNRDYWRIETITIANQPITTTGPVRIRFLYNLTAKWAPQSKRVTKEILINARFAAGGFRECYTAQESSVNNLQHDICNAFSYGSTSSGQVQMASWNETTQSCQTNTSSRTCNSTYQAIVGVTSSEYIQCGYLGNGYDAENLRDTSAPVQSCGGTQRLQVVGGRIRLTCP